jgi:ribosomal protein L30/L7E
MKQNQNGNARRFIERIGKLFDEVAPEELAEAEQELQALGLDPSRVGKTLEQLALKSIRTRVMREHSDAVRARLRTQFGVDLTTKLN